MYKREEERGRWGHSGREAWRVTCTAGGRHRGRWRYERGHRDRER